MSATVRFSAELRQWVVSNLDRGCTAGQLVQSMIEQKFDPAIAQGLVAAFIRARDTGLAVDEDSLQLELDAGGFQPDLPRLAAGNSVSAHDRDVPVLLRIQRPMIAVLGGVLSHEECDQLIDLARGRLRPSTITDPATGLETVAEHRNSEGMFFRLTESPFIASIDRRLSALMGAPIEHGEGLQVLRYGPGTQSTPHFDFLLASNPRNRESIARSGQRVATLVVYLNDLGLGGETVFPEIGLTVVPHKGHAVYFEYCDRLGRVDARSVHAGAPVLAGEKWAVTKWMRERRFISA